jgi:hypothetical protein
MTGKTNLNAVEEVIKYIEDVEDNQVENDQEIEKNNIDIKNNEVADEDGINEDINIEKNKDLIKENTGKDSCEDETVIDYIDENEIKKELEIITKEKETCLKYLDIMGNNNSSENDSDSKNDSDKIIELESKIDEDYEHYFDLNKILAERKELNLFTIDFNEKYEDKIKLILKEDNKLILNENGEEKEQEINYDEDLGSLESKINKLDINKKGKKKSKKKIKGILKYNIN